MLIITQSSCSNTLNVVLIKPFPFNVRLYQSRANFLPTANRQSTSSNTQEYSDIEIRDLDSSPTSALKRLPSVSEDERGTAAAAAASTDKMAVPDDGKWQRLASPRRKKEKDVFKFLKENDANYTIRRQKMQINIMLEKNQHVKKVGTEDFVSAIQKTVSSEIALLLYTEVVLFL